MSYAKGKNFNVVFLSLQYSAGDTYRGSGLVHTGFPKYFAPHLSTYRTTYNTRRSQSVANFLNVPKFNPQFTSPLSSLASVLPLMPPLFGIHSLKTSVHHPLWPLLERSSKPISTQRLILLSSLFFMASLWCRPVFCPWTLNLPIAMVLLHLRVHYSVEIKHYKSQIRIRIKKMGRDAF